MKIVDAKSLEAVHTVHLLTEVSLLNVACTVKLCLLDEMLNKYNITKTEIEPIY